jgi:hypothetical protein
VAASAILAGDRTRRDFVRTSAICQDPGRDPHHSLVVSSRSDSMRALQRQRCSSALTPACRVVDFEMIVRKLSGSSCHHRLLRFSQLYREKGPAEFAAAAIPVRQRYLSGCGTCQPVRCTCRS